MRLDLVPGHVFEMTVTESVPGHSYAFENEITPAAGQLVGSHEAYRIDAIGDETCRLDLVVSAWFVGELSAKALAREVTIMAMSRENALKKLKVQAEQGVEVVHRIEAAQMG